MVDQSPLLLNMSNDRVDESVSLFGQRETAIEVFVSSSVLLKKVHFALHGSFSSLSDSVYRLDHAHLEQRLQEVALACCGVQSDLSVRWRC